MSIDPRTQTPLVTPPAEEVVYLYPIATTGKRFLNYIIDTIVQYALVIGFSLLLGAAAGFVPAWENAMEGPWGTVIILFMYAPFFLYYIIMEATIGRTLGKIITNTRVLNRHNAPVSWWQAIGRTLFRLIPFEPFSVLSASGLAWHDSIAGTKVVDTSKPPQVIRG